MSGSISNLVVFQVDTATRLSSSSDTDNFQYIFNLNDEQWKVINAVSVTAISIPRSYYTVRTGLNYFTLNENGSQVVIFIPPGFYTNTQLFAALQAQLNANSPNAFTYSVFEWNGILPPVSSTSPPIPDLYKIAITVNSNLPISLIFDNTTQIDGLLGFFTGTNTFVVNGTSAYIISPELYNLSFENYLYLTSDIVNVDINDNAKTNSILCTIPMGSTPPGTYNNVKYDLIANMKPFNKKSKIFNFEIIDEFGNRSVDLNDVDISFSLAFFTHSIDKKYFELSTDLLKLLIEK